MQGLDHLAAASGGFMDTPDASGNVRDKRQRHPFRGGIGIKRNPIIAAIAL